MYISFMYIPIFLNVPKDSPKTKLVPDSLLLIKQFLEIINLFNLNENKTFVFNPELFKSFENLNFPDWRQYYPINNDFKDSPLSSINFLEMEFPIDFEDEEKILNESPIVKEIRKLSSKEQLQNEEVYLNKNQADLKYVVK